VTSRYPAAGKVRRNLIGKLVCYLCAEILPPTHNTVGSVLHK